MGRINPDLLNALRAKTGLGQAQIYKRINKVASNSLLPRDLAAVKLAADIGLTINRYATEEDLQKLRQAGSPVAPPVRASDEGGQLPASKKIKRSFRSNKKSIPNSVFVVHGRDAHSKKALFDFLRSVSVKPIEWNQALSMSRSGSPYIGDVLTRAFASARAIIVLITPDDLVQLREELWGPTEPSIEKRLAGQARPNVLFEAGMAFATHPDRTILVEVGSVKAFSDVAGRHVLRMNDSAEKRKEFITKLENSGCTVDQSGTDWLTSGDFSDPESRKSRSKKKAGPR